jgi:type IV pilus assembly protein PilY1
VTEAEDLAKAFREIIGKINDESAPLPDKIAGGGSTSGYNVSRIMPVSMPQPIAPRMAGAAISLPLARWAAGACPLKTIQKKTCIRFPM